MPPLDTDTELKGIAITAMVIVLVIVVTVLWFALK
jgi:hypothetical protein